MSRTEERDYTLEEFLRSFPLRGSQIMWFLGAGASASAGIPTAWHMIWEFKRSLYCSSERKGLSTVEDLSSDTVMKLIQASLDRSGLHPPADAQDEYAHYFEAAYRREQDRRTYIDHKVAGATPSYGHMVLAILMSAGRCDVVWTTNFDRVLEDAATKVFGSTSELRVVGAENTRLAREALSEKMFPLYVKLHGDYHSRSLKNTGDELRMQDELLRQSFRDACKTHGLAVVGYSGRDRSVMRALHEAVEDPNALPGGLFWFYRVGDPLFDSVTELIQAARGTGVDAELVPVETFDELMGDLLLLTPDVPKHLLEKHLSSPRAVSNVTVPDVKGSFPVVRLNAIRIFDWPRTCRLIDCDIGGGREVRGALSDKEVDAVATRSKSGVLAFGHDDDLRGVFSEWSIRSFDIHEIRPDRLRFESAEHGLMYDALLLALTRERPLECSRQGRRRYLIVKKGRERAQVLRPLLELSRHVFGTIPRTNLCWHEAAEVRIEYRLGRLWLIVLPTILADYSDDKTVRAIRNEFLRSELAKRYNKKTNDLVDAWVKVLTKNRRRCQVSAFDSSCKMNAMFDLGGVTAFSWRGGRS